jgi:hypothetical protein
MMQISGTLYLAPLSALALKSIAQRPSAPNGWTHVTSNLEQIVFIE